MLNYIRSELFRVTHSAAVYLLAAVFALMPLVLNLVLYVYSRSNPGSVYATASFSYSWLVSTPILFCQAPLVIVSVLYEEYRKSGGLKNAVASGISRVKVLAGQLAVSALVSVVILIITEAVYIAGAALLLPAGGPVSAADMLHEIWALLPLAAASVLLSVILLQLFQKSSAGIMAWFCVFIFVPWFLRYAARVWQPLQGIAAWLPYNFLSGMAVNTTQCAPIWDTAHGLARCLIAGGAGIVIFGIFGIAALSRKEL